MKRMLFAAVLVLSLLVPASNLFAEEDDHYIQTDDFFISKEAFKDQDWIYVYLAKQTKAPAKATKSEGQFLQVTDGKSVWTKFFWQTRQATAEDLKLGAVVFAADLVDGEGIYRVPENKEEARTCNWFLAKIVDVSDLYKDYVTVSGGYKVNVNALRVLITQ